MHTNPTYSEVSPSTHAAGFSTIEILLSFTVGTLFLTAALMLVVSGPGLNTRYSLDSSNTLVLDAALDTLGLSLLTQSLTSTTAALQTQWHRSISGSIRIDQGYAKNPPYITDISPCLKVVTNEISWLLGGGRVRNSSLSGVVSNEQITGALGGDCDSVPTSADWFAPQVLSRHSITSGTPVALDVLGGAVYLSDAAGMLHIINLQGNAINENGDFITPPFAAGATLFDVDVADHVDPTTGDRHRYAYTVRNSTSDQLQVIDVDNHTAPTSTPGMIVTFGGANPPRGSFPQGWRLTYYDRMVYALSRETAGFEFHIFDVGDPTRPRGVGPGFEVNGTANDIAVTDVFLPTTTQRIAILGTERSAHEIMVLNVSNPLTPTLITSLDLPTTFDVRSLYLIGNRLYVGRNRTTGGPELLVFEMTYSSTLPLQLTLTQLGTGVEIGADVTSIKVSGVQAFITTANANDAFQIFTIEKPTENITRIDTAPLRLSGTFPAGLDYSSPYVFVVSNALQSLQVIQSSP
ncbi:hypothetical protein K2Q16_03545 [Patescibacteria group bacterium]|nr:hypothetical protein [Patescibacteria group bacterium]